MTSEKRIVGYLSDKDYDLFQIALEKYDIKQSKLIQEVVHAWLFTNKLQLNQKNKKS